jgi:NADPH:quinone reductase
MRAVHVTKIGGPKVLHTVEIETPRPHDGTTLVRMTYAPIAFNDYMERADYFRHPGDPERATPYVPGTEGIGVIEQIVGEDYRLTVGQRVGFVVHNAHSYAEFTTVPTDQLVPLPDDIPDTDAAAVLASGMCARMLLFNIRDVGQGTSVLVTGATGSIDTLLISWASSLGAEVFAAVTSPAHRDALLSGGAGHVIDINTVNLAEEVRRLTTGAGVDLAIDGVGGDGWPQVFDSLGVLGTAVPYGITGGHYPPR